MSSRPQFNPYPVILNGDMSDDIISEVTIIQKLSLISYSYSWAGSSPSGTISVEVSNDYTQNADGSVRNAGTWNELPLSATPTVAGSTGNGQIDIDLQGSYAIRTVYTSISGTGALQAIINAKVS